MGKGKNTTLLQCRCGGNFHDWRENLLSSVTHVLQTAIDLSKRAGGEGWLLGVCSVGMHHFSVSIGVLDLPHLAAWLWEKSLLCMHFTCTEVFFCQGKWSKVVLWKRVQSQVLRWKIYLALEAVLCWKLVILGKLTFFSLAFFNYLFTQGISHEE